MSWIKNNLPTRLGSVETVVSRTAIIPATLDQESLKYLSDLILNPTELGLAGLFTKATDFISRLMYVPFKPTDDGTATKELGITTKFSVVTATINTHIDIKYLDHEKQLYIICERKIDRHFNNFADFNGYTKIDVYLPYYGFVSVNPNDVMGKYLQVLFGFDALGGQGTYYICVNDFAVAPQFATDPIAYNTYDNSRILSTHTFMIGSEIPLGSTNAGEISRNLLLGAVKVAGTALAYKSAEASGAFTTKDTTKTVTNYKKKNASTGGRMKLTGRTTRETTTTRDRSAIEKYRMKSSCFSTAMSALSSMHLEAVSDKPNSMVGLMDGSVNVHIVIYRPRIKEVSLDYGHYYGYPVGEVRELSTLSGYTEISSIHLEDSGFSTATDFEKDLIAEELSNGVIL